MKQRSINNAIQQNSVVYLDTNALNLFCDKFKGKSKKCFRYYQMPLSWPLIDETECNSSLARTTELADFAWNISNRKVLLTIRDLVALEVRSLLDNKPLSIADYYESDQTHIKALKEARKGTIPNKTRETLRRQLGEKKKWFQEWEKDQKRRWSSHFGSDKLFSDNWSEFSSLLIQERYFNQVLYGMISAYQLSNRFLRDDIMNLDHKLLRALSKGIEFYVALQFKIDSQTKKLGKPDRGDLPDVQHSYYVGLCDYFVTDDQRSQHILSSLLDTTHTKIINGEIFLKNLDSH